MAVQLAPYPRPVSVFNSFTSPHPETLVLREKVFSLSGDSFDITNSHGQPVLKVTGKVMTISGRKKVCDPAGNPLFDIVKKHFKLMSTYVAELPNGGGEVLEVKKNLKLFGSKATAKFESGGQAVTFSMKGDWFDTSAEIVDENGAVAAVIQRKLKSGSNFFRDIALDAQSYAVTVAPNVDKAVIAVMCICFDEINNDK